MGQNALSETDYRIFKSTISLEQNDSWKIEVGWKMLEQAWSEMGVVTLFSGL